MKLFLGGAYQNKLQTALEILRESQDQMPDDGKKDAAAEDLQQIEMPESIPVTDGVKCNAAESIPVTDGAKCSLEEIWHAQMLDHFHLYIKRCMEEGRDVSGLAQELSVKNPKIAIITTELGCGVVPMDAADRDWREQTGRICTQVAACSDEVYRIICGIGVRLK